MQMKQRLDAAVQAAIDSSSPGGGPLTPGDVDVLIHVGPAELEKQTGRRAALATAVVLGLTRGGRESDAVALVDRELSAAAQEGLDIASRAMFLSAAAEAYVTAGAHRHSIHLSERALSHARSIRDSVQTFRALTIVAVTRALNGEYTAAERAAHEARALQAEHGWPTSAWSYPLLLGDILLHSAKLDVSGLDATVIELRSTYPSEPLWLATANAAEAMKLLASNAPAGAIPLLLTVVSGGDIHGILAMIRGFALGVYADILLSRGEARRTLTLLRHATSPSGHVLCFDMQRAAAHLLLGDDRAALITTDACLRLGTEHCLRTIPPVLLRRAIAHERLGQRELADEQFEEAFYLLKESGSATPLLTLPRRPLRELLDRLDQTRPELSPHIHELRSRVSAVPPVNESRPIVPRLTAREERLAHELRSAKPLAVIAAQLHVSLNTLKSQARSLYGKLQVSTRQDAVQALEYAGFFD